MAPQQEAPQFSLALGISLGLLASFIQSLGLTIQRKSHLQNESLPPSHRKPDYARPVWLIGFSIYFGFNILGSIFQIGTLPLIILGPLGAISLLWNAILARFLLGDRFSIHLIFGTIFIGLGALLIGLFGLLPDQSNHHTLEQLLYLYSRTPFLVEIFVLILSFSIVCSFAHYHESRLNQSLESISLLTISPTPSNPAQQLSPILHHPDESPPNSSKNCKAIIPHPPHHYTSYRPRSTSSPTYSLSIPFPHQQQHHQKRQQGSVALIDSHIPLTPTFQNSSPRLPRSSKRFGSNHHSSSQVSTSKHNDQVGHDLLCSTQQKIDKLKFMIGVAYGSTSGTLSGICLLFAKTGVELLIRTLSGTENEFIKFQTWLILLVLLISALLQLWYLNKALRLVNPTLICPLAFCFYNLSSIISSLVYYDQIKLLSVFQVIAISMGTTVLLGGVWIVSNGTNSQPSKKILEKVKEEQGEEESMECGEDEVTPLLRSSSRIEDLAEEEEEEEEYEEEEEDVENQAVLSEEPMGIQDDFEDSTIRRIIRDRDRPRRSLQLDSTSSSSSHPFDHLIRQFVVDGHVTPVRGFSFGLGAASPGFAIRPKKRNLWVSHPSNHRSFSGNSYPTSRRQLSPNNSNHVWSNDHA